MNILSGKPISKFFEIALDVDWANNEVTRVGVLCKPCGASQYFWWLLASVTELAEREQLHLACLEYPAALLAALQKGSD